MVYASKPENKASSLSVPSQPAERLALQASLWYFVSLHKPPEYLLLKDLFHRLNASFLLCYTWKVAPHVSSSILGAIQRTCQFFIVASSMLKMTWLSVVRESDAVSKLYRVIGRSMCLSHELIEEAIVPASLGFLCTDSDVWWDMWLSISSRTITLSDQDGFADESLRLRPLSQLWHSEVVVYCIFQMWN